MYDPGGNLQYRTNNQLTANFMVNSDNELTANSNGGKITVMGTTTSSATNVTVNLTNTAQLYGDWTFAATNFPILSSYTAVAKDKLGRVSTNTVNVDLSTDNTAYVYDGNGNLLYDGTRTFAWDNENELIQVLVSNQWLSQFSYDGKMRRRIRHEYTWQSGQWVQTNAVYYVYDGNCVIQERNANNLPTTTYTRGNDVSSSLQGAGGIGGLLSMTLNYVPGTLNSNSFFYHADGNGNVTMLINPSQYIVAKYLYDAFGNVLSASGLMAQQNLYRFSSKVAHLNSGLVYYLYRFYDPNLQRWPNRDPIGEQGFENLRSKYAGQVGADENLYTFVLNSAINITDPFGLALYVCTRHVEGAPWIGNHVYLWDSQGNGGQGQSCGRQGKCGKGPNSNNNDTGPNTPGQNCHLVAGATPSQIQAAMQCCSQTANNGIWFPWVNDCHNSINRCLKKAGLPKQPNPRFGGNKSGEEAMAQSANDDSCSGGD